MGESSKIEWTDHTFNPWWGCTKISRACKRCYAATFAARWLQWGPDAPPREFGLKHWNDPVRWDKAAKRDGVRRRVFCASMADVFEARDNEHGPTLDRLRARLFELIEACDGLDWQLLTKRPENMQAMVPASWRSGWPRHVWAGATVENQATALERVPHLLAVPAAVRFLSCEPLTGAIDLTHLNVESHPAAKAAQPIGWYAIDALSGRNRDMGRPCPDAPTVQWVIAGGESGPGARPSHPDWFRSLRDQCDRAGVPFFFKQWGDWGPDPMGGHPQRVGHEADGEELARIGKRAAGRHLDGRTHDGVPGEVSGA